MNIPSCDIGLIGGSATFSINMPETLTLPNVTTEKSGLVFNTPFGLSPEFKVFYIHRERNIKSVLACKMHGWRRGVSRSNASRQVFWVFRNAGVKRVLAEGGVGAINHLLTPPDLLIPDDYLDNSMYKDVSLDDNYLLIMRDALCPEMRRVINEVCRESWDGRIFDRGVYVNTDGFHLETASEINQYRIAGGDVVGQSLCPEVYLAREIGACYAGIYLVADYAEGVLNPHKKLQELFYSESCAVGRLLINIISDLPAIPDCDCFNLRKETPC
ncbi:MAG TPA: MTAP family purine nucleoside phosphorylase [Syntrophomonadaceae bacterium]|nr:MTAP family purine nucleoside phosphorylase [Syntrophomonadaceae bacterium]